MSKTEQKVAGKEVPDWLAWWEKKLLEEGHASLVTVNLRTGLESISDPSLCCACERPTIKAFVPHSVVSTDQRLIIGTPNLPGYRCEECKIQEPQGPDTLYYLSKKGLFEFETTAAQILESRGYTADANLFRQASKEIKDGYG